MSTRMGSANPPRCGKSDGICAELAVEATVRSDLSAHMARIAKYDAYESGTRAICSG